MRYKDGEGDGAELRSLATGVPSRSVRSVASFPFPLSIALRIWWYLWFDDGGRVVSQLFPEFLDFAFCNFAFYLRGVRHFF